MADKFLPREISGFFFLDVVLIFLMINYNLPLATIYTSMAIVASFMYYVAMDQKAFVMLPFAKQGTNKLLAMAVGVGLGVGFLYFYNYLGLAGGKSIFAATAFGDSETIGKLVYGVLIALLETRFFFAIIMQWYAWKAGISWTTDILSFDSIQLMAIFAAIFTVFHATVFGITNNAAFIAAAVLAVVSIGAIILTQELIHASVMHVVVNSYIVGLFDFITTGAWLSSPWVIGGGLVALYFITKKGGIRSIVPI